MVLSPDDSALFFKLYKNLLIFTNSKWGIYENINSTKDYDDLGIKQQFPIRNKLYEGIQIIDEFYEQNPAELPELELGLVLKWKDCIQDQFLFYKQYKKYCAVFDSKNFDQTVSTIIEHLTVFLKEHSDASFRKAK